MKFKQLLKVSSSVFGFGFGFGLLVSPIANAHQDKMTKADTDLVIQIRKDLASDSSLSVYAQDLKIIALNGKVILKGTIRSESDKLNIYNEVVAEPGVSSVVSKLEVKPVEY